MGYRGRNIEYAETFYGNPKYAKDDLSEEHENFKKGRGSARAEKIRRKHEREDDEHDNWN